MILRDRAGFLRDSMPIMLPSSPSAPIVNTYANIHNMVFALFIDECLQYGIRALYRLVFTIGYSCALSPNVYNQGTGKRRSYRQYHTPFVTYTLDWAVFVIGHSIVNALPFVYFIACVLASLSCPCRVPVASLSCPCLVIGTLHARS